MVEWEHDLTSSRAELKRQRPLMCVLKKTAQYEVEFQTKIFSSNRTSLKEQTPVMISRKLKTFLLGRMFNLLISLYTVFWEWWPVCSSARQSSLAHQFLQVNLWSHFTHGFIRGFGFFLLEGREQKYLDLIGKWGTEKQFLWAYMYWTLIGIG